MKKMTRFDEITSLFDRGKLFKLVCGAGNEDAKEVLRLVFVYTLAGAKVFDVSANTEVVRSAVQGIDAALKYAAGHGRRISIRPVISVSIGMKGDPHARKAKITDKCTKCGMCILACPMKAISKALEVQEARCIGCGHCEVVCGFHAIEFYHKNKNLRKLLLQCKDLGMEQVELHAAVSDSKAIFEDWKMVNAVVPDNYVSMCLDRLHLGDSQLRRRIQKAREIAGDRLIIQADGVPMSGCDDNYNTTLQAVAIADIIQKAKISAKIVLSGGTNSLTAKLANLCAVGFHGVAVGTFARNLVSKIIEKKDFFSNKKDISKAVTLAQKLVKANIGEPVW